MPRRNIDAIPGIKLAKREADHSKACWT